MQAITLLLPSRLQRFVLPLCLLLLALTTAPVNAQTQGSIVGTIKDTAGAVVPGADLTLTNTDEGTVRTTKSNGTGDYRFEDVKAGHYSITATATGFDKWIATGVTLTVRQQLRVDATVNIGSVQQSIQVTGDSISAIDTDTATISGTFNSEQVANLPVNTRASFNGTSAAAIFGTLPGVQDDASGISVQGALPYQVEVTVDGATVKDPAGGGFIKDALPSSESIAEIRADGVMAGAEFSDPGQVVVTTKGGSNVFHGSAFWYYQSSAFNAIAYTLPTTITKPSQHGNTFGGSFGGPVILPHFNGKNKTFFYGGYEGWRHPAQDVVNETLPSTLMKKGDFSNYKVQDENGDLIVPTLVNPYTGTPYAGNVVTNINTIAANALKQFYPDPNVGNPADYVDGQDANYQRNADNSGNSNQFDVRGDQYFGANQKFLIWGRYTWKNFTTTSPQILNLPSSQSNNQNRVLVVDTNWSIKPNLINEGKFSFTRYISGDSNSFDGKAWTDAQNFVGLQNLFFNGIPHMDFNNIQGVTADRLTGLNKSFTYEYSDSLIWTKGRHTMKFGVDIEQLEALSPLGFAGADNYGTYSFNTSASEGMFTGVDFGDFLLGLPNTSSYDVVRQDNDGISQHYHVFAQDEWHMNSRLTLSYGVRYELHPGYYDKYGDIGNFDPSVEKSGRVLYPQGKQDLLAQQALINANACNPDGINNTNSAVVNGAPCMPVQGNETAGVPSGLKTYPKLRFMPRIGFAYRPFANDKWAIRGGFGLYNINMLGSSFYSLTGTLQAATQDFQNTYNPATHAILYGWPNVKPGVASGSTAPEYGTAYFGTANSVNWKDPYTEQWSLSVDHDFGSGYAARVSYIGSATHHLVWAPDENTLPFSTTVAAYNAPISSRRFPNWGVINTRETGANARYNSLQVEASHRMQHGLQYNSGFTWAKNLADNQGPNNTSFAGENGGGRATSILDRHVDFGNAYGTRRLRWNTTALYDLPFGRGKMIGGGMSRIADEVVGGWRLSGILTVQTGPFLTPYFPGGEGDPSGTGSGMSGALGDGTGTFALPGRAQHPDLVAGASNKPTDQTRYKWLNASAFACPGDATWTPGTRCTTGAGVTPGKTPAANALPIGRFGNSGVGTTEGPGLVNLSAGLSKSISITERLKLKAEGTFTNVLNHTNLGNPVLDLSSSSFGRIKGTIGSDFGGARTGQVSMRLEF